MDILYEDEHCFAIDKPEGFFVHPPEASKYPVPSDRICLYVLQDHFKRNVYPVHRLDAPTSGVLLFAFSRDSTRRLSELFMNRQIQKTYLAVARGHLPESGKIELPLEIKGFENTMPSETHFRTIHKAELPFPVGKKYPTARYSYLEVQPQTGRWHQIRRHFDRISHPLLGDIEHGDSHHNRFFRDQLQIRGLCLRAVALSFENPWSQAHQKIEAPMNVKWQRIESLFKIKNETAPQF